MMHHFSLVVHNVLPPLFLCHGFIQRLFGMGDDSQREADKQGRTAAHAALAVAAAAAPPPPAATPSAAATPSTAALTAAAAVARAAADEATAKAAE